MYIFIFLYCFISARGTNLITSGWWGLARKINYTGDWLFGLSWSLFTGFGSILTYFYPIYFAILLIHRAWRDDIMQSFFSHCIFLILLVHRAWRDDIM